MIIEADLKMKFTEKNFLLLKTVASIFEVVNKIVELDGSVEDLLNFMSGKIYERGSTAIVITSKVVLTLPKKM